MAYLYGEDGDDTLVGGNSKNNNWQYLYGGSGHDSIDAKGGTIFYTVILAVTRSSVVMAMTPLRRHWHRLPRRRHR